MSRSIADQVRAYLKHKGEDGTPSKLAEAVAMHQRDLPLEKRCKRQNIESLLERDFRTVRYLIPLAKAMGTTAEILSSGAYEPPEIDADSLEAKDDRSLVVTPSAPPSSPIEVPVAGDPVPIGYVRLQHLSPTPSMGPGKSLSEPAHIIRHLDVLESWVRQKVGSTNYDRIKILTGCGQSMLPTIHDNDLVFVDMGQKSIDVPGIYVLDICDRLLLKRALILSNGVLVLRSDNSDEFPDEERIDLKSAADTVNVAGRVKAWWTLHQG